MQEFKPKTYPHDILKKDWTKRQCFADIKELEFLNLVHDMPVYEDDVWLVTLQKCGTTWMQELLWLLLHDCDFEAANAEELVLRSPYMEFDFRLHGDLSTALQRVQSLARPRLIKSHLELPLLPAQLWSCRPKTIYVFRNPKDAFVSRFYHEQRKATTADMNINSFIQQYLIRSVKTQLPFEHALEFYMLRNEPWIFYTSFERMKLNLRQVISELCVFLNKSITEEQMQQLLKHLSFEQMKNNPRTNHNWEFEQLRHKLKQPYVDHNFIRKGQVGSYKEELNADTIELLDKWLEAQLALYQSEHPGLSLNDLLLLNN